MNQDEDVKVILAYDRHYKFHSGTLARNSPLLAAMLTEAKAAKLGHKARSAGVKVRWMIELVRLPDEYEPAGALELLELNANGEPVTKRPIGVIVNENGRTPTKIFEYYEAILYAFYNAEIHICDTDMVSVLDDSIGMLDVAKYLGCVNIIRKPVELALTKHGQPLFRSISKGPAVWADLGLDLLSETIFRESVIHLAGNWKKWRANRETMERLHPSVRQLAEKYHRRITEKGKDLELKVMSAYPGDICRPSEDLPIKREAYAKDILIWMALSFFRHWFGQRTLTNGHFFNDSGYALYQQLGAGGDAYMDKTVINQFHERFPMTKKAMNVLENHLLEIKMWIKKLVAESGILVSKCQLDITRYPVQHLTCVDFERTDCPWLKEGWTLQMPARGNPARRPGGNEISKQQLAAAKRMQERAAVPELSEDDTYDEDDFDYGTSEPKRTRLN